MSKQASQFQKIVMSIGYRGKEIFKPMPTGWIDEHTACVREWIANIFFYTKNGTTIMIDAGYNYPRLAEKISWLDIDPAEIRHIFLTHQDTDHVGALERDSDGLFRNAEVYLSAMENRYMTGELRRKVIFGLYKLPMVISDNHRTLLEDGQVLDISGIKVECLLVPGHTWGHMVYIVDDRYVFTGDTLWLGADGGYSFINSLAEDNDLSKRSLAALAKTLRERGRNYVIVTGHTGWTDDLDFAFAHIDRVCNSLKTQKPHDPDAPYDGYDETDDTEEKARTVRISPQTDHSVPDYANWVPKGMIVGFAGGAAVLSAACALSVPLTEDASLRVKCGMRGILAAGALGCGAAALWLNALHKQFSYEGERKMAKQIVEGTAAYIQVPEGGKILDVGCGSGALSIACAKRNPQAEVFGIDPWGPEYASYSRKRCEDNARAEKVRNVHFENGNAVRLDYPDESFDAVTSNYVYHNIAGHNKQKLLRETLRVLKKGGTFAIHDIMSPLRYGDMQKFMKELKDEGYEDVRLIPTDEGLFMTAEEARWMTLKGSALLVGRK